jgi:hypothetical protein
MSGKEEHCMTSQSDDLDEEAFAAELERRRAEMINDPSIGIPWKEVLEDRAAGTTGPDQ